MFAREAQFLLLHVERSGVFNLVLSLFDITDGTLLFQLGERTLHSLDVIFVEFLLYHRVIVPVDERVLLCLVLQNPHLCVHIVLHAEVVAVQMVRCDVQQDGDVCPEVIHVVKLEGAEFYDIVFMRLLRHLQRQALSDVAGQSGVITCVLEYMIDKRRCSRLSVASRYAHHLGVCVSSGELNLADDMYVLLHTLSYHRRLLRYARTLYYLVSVENLLLGVVAFLPFHAVVVKELLVFVLDGRHVRHEHVETLFLCQYGSSGSTLASSKYNNSFHITFAI